MHTTKVAAPARTGSQEHFSVEKLRRPAINGRDITVDVRRVPADVWRAEVGVGKAASLGLPAPGSLPVGRSIPCGGGEAPHACRPVPPTRPVCHPPIFRPAPVAGVGYPAPPANSPISRPASDAGGGYSVPPANSPETGPVAGGPTGEFKVTDVNARKLKDRLAGGKFKVRGLKFREIENPDGSKSIQVNAKKIKYRRDGKSFKARNLSDTFQIGADGTVIPGSVDAKRIKGRMGVEQFEHDLPGVIQGAIQDMRGAGDNRGNIGRRAGAPGTPDFPRPLGAPVARTPRPGIDRAAQGAGGPAGIWQPSGDVFLGQAEQDVSRFVKGVFQDVRDQAEVWRNYRNPALERFNRNVADVSQGAGLIGGAIRDIGRAG